MIKKIKRIKRIKKIKRRIKKESVLPVVPVDLGTLNNLLMQISVELLKAGDLDKLDRILEFVRKIKTFQTKELTYERAFILNHLERHGFLGDTAEEKYPLSKQEAEELKQIFGDGIEDVKELMSGTKIIKKR